MNLLLSADVHGDHDIYRWLARTASELSASLVLAGDLLGCPDGYGSVEEAQRADAERIFSLLARARVPVYYIWGNDDVVEIAPESPRIVCVHERRVELGRWNLVGYQHSPPFVGGPHERPEECIASDLTRISPLIDQSTIFVTHSPAYGILDVGLLDRHAGNRSIRDVVRARDAYAHVHGHIHQAFGRWGRHYNVAASGSCRAILLDLEAGEHRVLQGQESGS